MHPEPNVSLRSRNTLRLESTAEFFASIASEHELQQALAWSLEKNLPVTPIGEGSNVVCRQQIPGLVLGMGLTGIQLLSDDGTRIRLRVAAGENWHAFVRWASRQGFYGLENLALIPGSVGAAPVQNIGAYGVELADFVDAVHACHRRSAELVEFSREQCQFSYRQSFFKSPQGRDFIITAVDFVLNRVGPLAYEYPALAAALQNQDKTPENILEAVIQIRRQRLPDPSGTPNVGSFFKNPEVSWHDAEVISMRWPKLPQYPAKSGQVKLSAAWMIDQLGWRGKVVNGIAISSEHALILINESADSIDAVLDCAEQILNSVEAEFGVRLAIEPDILG